MLSQLCGKKKKSALQSGSRQTAEHPVLYEHFEAHSSAFENEWFRPLKGSPSKVLATVILI